MSPSCSGLPPTDADEVCASDHEALVNGGWQRRFLADPARAREAHALYGELGLEVRSVRLHPEDFATACSDCPASVCREHVLIYTRPRADGEGKRGRC